jgi:hypothetical protein
MPQRPGLKDRREAIAAIGTPPELISIKHFRMRAGQPL